MSQLVQFGTKAETLQRLHGTLESAVVAPLLFMTVARWQGEREAVLTELRTAFAPAAVAVRSSAIGEDAADESRAGAYTSVLHVTTTDEAALAAAVDEVVASYGGDPRDQVLVQPMVPDVAVAGVLTTYDVQSGAPYYVVEYDDETGATDTVTGGTTAHRSVLVHRSATDAHVQSERLRSYLALARELEVAFGGAALDIEFALTRDGQLVLLQVRRIGVARTWHPATPRRVERSLRHVTRYVRARSNPTEGVVGRRTVLGVMPDWNPAEIIGERPRSLAATLYRLLVTRDVWRESRKMMGYRPVDGEELMVTIGDRAFIDIRLSFNSFIPADVPDATAGLLVDAWIDRLRENPELHDRVEFEVATTCVDLDTQAVFRDRYPALLEPAAERSWLNSLTTLTRNAYDLGPTGTLARAGAAIDNLAANPVDLSAGDPAGDLHMAVRALGRCRTLGTLPFATLARHAFIAEAMLRSAVRQGVLDDGRLQLFRASVSTVSTSLGADHQAVLAQDLSVEEFLARHGHLRPGTYDVTSLRYDERSDLFDRSASVVSAPVHVPFEVSPAERRSFDRLLDEAGLHGVTSDVVLQHARAAIVGREHAKHVFTRTLSDALVLLTRWALAHGLSRDDLSHLDMDVLSSLSVRPVLDDLDRALLAQVDEQKRLRQDMDGLRLGYLVRDAADVYVVPVPRSVPSFVGSTRVTGRVVQLGRNDPASSDLYGAIVAIDSADPGYDWIFTCGIAGLVTRFGGTNSHMAIRCAEHGLPAAIGCGDRAFERVVSADSLTLDAQAGQLLPVGER